MGMSGKFSGQVVLVAGGTGGLGKAVTLAFLHEGASVIATYIHKGEADALKDSVGPNAPLELLPLDATDEAATSSLVSGITARHGRLDVLVTGFSASNSPITQVWRNNLPTTNTSPSAPSGLNLTVSNTMATLTWSSATDNQTPAAGLTYNLRIGTTPGGSDMLSPMSAADGFRRLPQLGGAQHGLSATIQVEGYYAVGTPYYWSVQAVDSAFAGSPFAAESSFKFLPVAVSVTSSNFIPGDAAAVEREVVVAQIVGNDHDDVRRARLTRCRRRSLLPSDRPVGSDRISQPRQDPRHVQDQEVARRVQRAERERDDDERPEKEAAHLRAPTPNLRARPPARARARAPRAG